MRARLQLLSTLEPSLLEKMLIMEKIANDASVQTAAASIAAASITALLDGITVEGLTDQNLKNVSGKVTGFIARYLNADHGYMILKNKQGQLVSLASIYNNGHDDTLITYSGAIIEKVIQTGQSTIVTDAMGSNELPHDPDLQRFNITAFICAPTAAEKSS